MDLHAPLTITLSYNDFAQILDGIRVVEEQWAATLRYHQFGDFDTDVPTLECTDTDEAEKMLKTYRELVATLESHISSAVRL